MKSFRGGAEGGGATARHVAAEVWGAGRRQEDCGVDLCFKKELLARPPASQSARWFSSSSASSVGRRFSFSLL